MSAAFLLWMLVGFSAVYWWLRLAGTAGNATPLPPALVALPQVDASAVGRLLGGDALVADRTAPAAQSPGRFVLVGVAASRSRDGAALISVDGKPARPFRVGSQVDAGLVLQAVAPRSAQLGASAVGAPTITLDLPAPRGSNAGGAPAAATAPAAFAAPLPAPRFATQAPVPAPGSPSLSQIAPEGVLPRSP